MSENKQVGTSGLNRAKPYQLVLQTYITFWCFLTLQRSVPMC